MSKLSRRKEGPPGRLVETGAFRVDRRRALEKLRDFSVPEGGGGPLLLVRCAVASGASVIRIHQQPGWLELRFDGRPFARRDLLDPYGCLFEDSGAASPAGRYLALGLLRILRGEPKQLSVRSGLGAERQHLSIRSLSEDALEPAPDDGETETVIQAAWGAFSGERAAEFQLPPERYLSACRMSPASVCLNDVLIYDHEEDAPAGLAFSAGSARGVLALPERLDPHGILLEFFVYGVSAGHTAGPHERLPIRGWINDDGLRLDASMSAVVKNARHDAACRLAESKIPELVRATAAEQGARMRRIADFQRAGAPLSGVWSKIALGADASREESWTQGAWEAVRPWLRSGRARRLALNSLLEDAHATFWLREAVDVFLKPAARPPADDALRSELWRAPVLLGTDLRPLSLFDLDSRPGPAVQYRGEPVARHLLAEPVVWCVSKLDLRWLGRRFPGALKEAKD